MGLGPQVKSVNNAATPVAENFAKYLEGLLSQGAGAQPVGPLQAGAGKAITNFVNTGVNRLASGGVDAGTQAMVSALTETSNVNTKRAAGDLKEIHGSAGNRYSKALGDSTALLESDANRGLNEVIANIFMNRQAQNEGNLLAGITEMSRQGEAALIPYLALLQLGLPQAENVVSPGIGSQILSGVTSAGAAYLGRGRG